jgi:UrcA family protein
MNAPFRTKHLTGDTAMSRFAPFVSPRPRAFAGLTALGALAMTALLAQPNIATAAQPAAAAAPQTTVSYSFGDLATDQGTRALYQRILSAARTVCPAYDSRDLEAAAYSWECQRQAVARAIRQIGDPRLAAVYSHKLARRG